VTVALNAERTEATIELGGTTIRLTTAELERLIRELDALRRQMAPEVPFDPPLGVVVDTILDPRFWVSPEPIHSGVLLSLRHLGLGWLSFQLPPEECDALRRLLLDVLDREQPSQH
jgi:hypothetical protein